jgi:hypothetical protein
MPQAGRVRSKCTHRGGLGSRCFTGPGARASHVAATTRFVALACAETGRFSAPRGWLLVIIGMSQHRGIHVGFVLYIHRCLIGTESIGCASSPGLVTCSPRRIGLVQRIIPNIGVEVEVIVSPNRGRLQADRQATMPPTGSRASPGRAQVPRAWLACVTAA